jgi:protoheme IX farnesyltransferase
MGRAQHITRPTILEGVALWGRQLKLPLSLAIAAASVAGFILGPRASTGAGVLFFVGILMLAGGCGALNNYQDRDLDARFRRTRWRPLPSGRIKPKAALIVALVLIGGGLSVLALVEPWVAALGVVALCFYNVLYTPLKRKTLWALVPGVVCGMLPPSMGWVAAGGPPLALEVWSLMILFAVWQIPHFWLLMLSHGDEYRGKAELKLTGRLTLPQIERILMVWVTSLGAIILCLPLVGLIQTPWIQVALFALTLALTATFLAVFLRSGLKQRSKWLFAFLNGAVFLCLALVVTERLRLFRGVF